MYVCQFVRLLIPFVVAASLFSISLSVLRILLEDCRSLSATDPFDNHILKVSKCGDKWSGKHVHALYMCLCVQWLYLTVCVYGCLDAGTEGDWQTNRAPETHSLCFSVCLFPFPPPTLCLHLWLCKPPHNVGALKWQWKLWLIFVKTHSLPPCFRMRVRW